MRWMRPPRLPVLIAWLVILGVLVWLGTHPRLVAPYASSLVSRHLLRIEEGGLRVRDFRSAAVRGHGPVRRVADPARAARRA